jgi:hypothetical protein
MLGLLVKLDELYKRWFDEAVELEAKRTEGQGSCAVACILAGAGIHQEGDDNATPGNN